MFRISVLPRVGVAVLLIASAPLAARADGAKAITGQDVNGHPVDVNGAGRYTVVMYTNPDLEDESRAITLALDPFRSRSDFSFVRVVDLRGNVPPEMRGIVRSQIRQEMVRENKRLKDQRGITNAGAHAPIIADFSGSTLDALGWDSTYSAIRVVVYDTKGREVKRLAAADAKQVTKAVGDIL